MISKPTLPPLFRMGRIVSTPGALEAIQNAGQKPLDFLARHMTGDWGDLDEHDRLCNDRALRAHDRILSAYHTSMGDRIWIITEADRSTTTLLLPEEY